MTKQELEKAIENGESVWACDDFLHRVIPYKANEIAITGINTKMPAYELKDLFATKQQAEHYLHHANVTRVEQLPFLTWEEFCGRNILRFDDGNHITFYLELIGGKIRLTACGRPELNKTWKATEANFYKAYDECVRLFRGEE